MRDRSALLEDACAAMIAGDPLRCAAVLERFSASARRRALSEAECSACAAQLERLRILAQSACKGIESARAWLTTLTEITGGLDIYDRGGRQRVPTELSGKDRRF
ncbi:hypothetical protein B0A89_09515 [Paracoccus contaminans]|uniref:Flagellar protein FlgN n=2 Tax=Paracoccus contaminans TaxID=1945662 RepID=A0A1W6CY77_9RHOB|nr:hypothetical protein B0A89_09515 [Paracoccus contaminans]